MQKRKKGGLTRPAEDEKGCEDMKLRVGFAPLDGSSSVANLAAYFVARFVVNRRQAVLLAAMLFCLMQHFVRTGTFCFPGTSGKACVGAAE
jgi:hypothetical protein